MPTIADGACAPEPPCRYFHHQGAELAATTVRTTLKIIPILNSPDTAISRLCDGPELDGGLTPPRLTGLSALLYQDQPSPALYNQEEGSLAHR